MKVKFKKRYVLGIGYPWMMGSENPPHTNLLMALKPTGLIPVDLDWPGELWDQDLPQYRLVLERVEKGEKK